MSEIRNAWVRRQTAIEHDDVSLGGSSLCFTGKYEVVVTESGWGQVGKVVSIHDTKEDALNMCLLINGRTKQEVTEEISWYGGNYERRT